MENASRRVPNTPLKTLRVKKGLTTTAVAAKVGIDQGTYWRIENGAGTTPETAEKIARYFAADGLTEIHVLYPERFVAPKQRKVTA